MTMSPKYNRQSTLNQWTNWSIYDFTFLVFHFLWNWDLPPPPHQKKKNTKTLSCISVSQQYSNLMKRGHETFCPFVVFSPFFYQKLIKLLLSKWQMQSMHVCVCECVGRWIIKCLTAFQQSLLRVWMCRPPFFVCSRLPRKQCLLWNLEGFPSTRMHTWILTDQCVVKIV